MIEIPEKATIGRMVGEKLDKIGKYEVVGYLGSGFEGDVFKVKAPETEKLFAMKVLFALGVPALYESRAEFLFRSRSVSKIIGHHNHIVQMVDSGDDDVVMSCGKVPCYFNVYNLVDKRPTRQKEDPILVATIGEQMTDALSHIHAMSIVHRDIKPDNILVNKQNWAWLADLGLSYDPNKAAHEERRDEEVTLGTPKYMSPEQTMTRFVGPASDIYSLGTTLYEMIEGVGPHRGSSPISIMYKIRTQPPRIMKREMPARLERTIRKMMLADSERRGAAPEHYQEFKEIVRQG